MNKSVGTWAIIGLVIVAAYLWLTGKIGSASGTLAGFTGSPGTGTTNPTLTGGLLALESALGLTGTALGNSLALQAGAAANTQVTPVVASSTGDYLPATPAPDINIPTPVPSLTSVPVWDPTTGTYIAGPNTTSGITAASSPSPPGLDALTSISSAPGTTNPGASLGSFSSIFGTTTTVDNPGSLIGNSLDLSGITDSSGDIIS